MVRQLLIASAMLCAFAFAAVAEEIAIDTCYEAMELHNALAENYGETLFFVGTIPEGGGEALFGNPDTGTWTRVKLSEGVACVLAFGTGFIMQPLYAGEQA